MTLRQALLALAIGAALPGGAFARCEGVVPQPKPQNTSAQDVGREFDRIIEEGWIEFAVYEDFAPWSYEQGGTAKGVDVEIGRLIAADLGVEARFRLVQASETLEADLLNYVWKGAVVGGHVSDVMLHVPYDSALVCRIEHINFLRAGLQAMLDDAADQAGVGIGGPLRRHVPADVGFDNHRLALLDEASHSAHGLNAAVE